MQIRHGSSTCPFSVKRAKQLQETIHISSKKKNCLLGSTNEPKNGMKQFLSLNSYWDIFFFFNMNCITFNKYPHNNGYVIRKENACLFTGMYGSLIKSTRECGKTVLLAQLESPPLPMSSIPMPPNAAHQTQVSIHRYHSV